jgi:hypothetical protein
MCRRRSGRIRVLGIAGAKVGIEKPVVLVVAAMPLILTLFLGTCRNFLLVTEVTTFYKGKWNYAVPLWEVEVM